MKNNREKLTQLYLKSARRQLKGAVKALGRARGLLPLDSKDLRLSLVQKKLLDLLPEVEAE